MRAYGCGREVVVAYNKKEATKLVDRYDLFKNVATGKRDEKTHPVVVLDGDVIVEELDQDNHVLKYNGKEVFQYSDEVNSDLNELAEDQESN